MGGKGGGVVMKEGIEGRGIWLREDELVLTWFLCDAVWQTYHPAK